MDTDSHGYERILIRVHPCVSVAQIVFTFLERKPQRELHYPRPGIIRRINIIERIPRLPERRVHGNIPRITAYQEEIR